MATIPDQYRDLLDRPITVALATLCRMGSRRSTPSGATTMARIFG